MIEGPTSTKRAARMNARLIGLVSKVLQLPRERMSERHRLLSNIGPGTRPRMTGATG